MKIFSSALLCDSKFLNFLSHNKAHSAKDAQLAVGKLAVNGTACARRLRGAQSNLLWGYLQ